MVQGVCVYNFFMSLIEFLKQGLLLQNYSL